jgi:hypothetical protein
LSVRVDQGIDMKVLCVSDEDARHRNGSRRGAERRNGGSNLLVSWCSLPSVRLRLAWPRGWFTDSREEHSIQMGAGIGNGVAQMFRRNLSDCRVPCLLPAPVWAVRE